MFPIATTTCTVLASTTECVTSVLSGTSTPPLYVPLVSAGDIGTMFFLAILVVVFVYSAIFR